jgi:hypothetical protein
VSNKLNASRISSISSSLKPGLSYDLVGRLLAALPDLAADIYIEHTKVKLGVIEEQGSGYLSEMR